MAVARDEEAETVLLEGAVPPHLASGPTRRATLLTASLLAASVAALSLLAWQREGRSKGLLTRVSSHPQFVGLNEEPDVCASMPYLKLNKVKSSNLGKKGPQKDMPEGLIYEVTPVHEELNVTGLELHFHVVSKNAFTDEEAAEQLGKYQPAWAKENGIQGGFAAVNIKHGTNVTLQIHGYDPVSKKDLVVPKAAITFFDLDTGKGGNRSIEYIKVDDYSAYYVTNETEVKVTHGDDGSTTFTASTEGDGTDNPKDPLALTVQQKNRAVSLEFENDSGVIIQLGASPGATDRVFSFVFRPALRCAQTVLPGGTKLDPNSTDSPITVVRNAGGQARPLLALVLGLALVGSPKH